MKTLLITLAFIASTPLYPSQNPRVFINEIHYDNSGADKNEGFEIAGPAGTDLSGWNVELYNGNNGKKYKTVNLTGEIPNEKNGFGAIWFSKSSIQNGAPDGMALINSSGQVISFLSYEGSFTAINGSAAGLSSLDIVVSENGNTPEGNSLQLIGDSGSFYRDFSWTGPVAASPGLLNENQSFKSIEHNPLEIERAHFIDEKHFALKFNSKINSDSISLANFSANFLGGLDQYRSFGDSLILRWTNDFPQGALNEMVISNFKNEDGIPQKSPFVFEFSFNHTQPKIVLTEIMYNPPETGSDSTEFIEIYNAGNNVAKLGGLTFSKGISFSMPYIDLAPGDFFLLGDKEEILENLYPNTDFYEWKGALGNSGETIELVNTRGDIIFSVEYDNKTPWPTSSEGTDGRGSSIELSDPTNNSSYGENWLAAINYSGTGDELIYYATPGTFRFMPNAVISMVGKEAQAYEGETVNIPLMIKNNHLPLEFSVAITQNQQVSPDAEVIGTAKKTVLPNTAIDTLKIHLMPDAACESLERVKIEIRDLRNARLGNGEFDIEIGDTDQIQEEICINEFLALNQSWTNQIGETPAWIELYNNSNMQLNLSGYILSSTWNGEVYESRLSDGLIIDPKSFKVLWLDSFPHRGPNHISSAIDPKAGGLILSDPLGTPVASYEYGEQLADISEGRIGDCGIAGQRFNTPSPGEPNNLVSISEMERMDAISFWPNPAVELINRKAEHSSEDWEIIDTRGRLIKTWPNGENRLELKGLKPGVYLVKATNGNIIGKLYR